MFAESIDTNRFVLRVPRPTDGAAVYDAVSDVIEQLRAWPGSWPWASQPQSVAVSTAHCERARGCFEAQQRWNMFVFDKNTNKVVGNAEFHTIHRESRMWELGVWTRPGWQHRGVMTEALTTLLAWMKTNNADIEIVIKIDCANSVSKQLAKKVGFKSVGVYEHDGYVLEMLSSNPRIEND